MTYDTPAPYEGNISQKYFRQLSELAFPNEGGSGSVCVKELVCIHLGLLPVATAVQQARRLAHAVRDVAGDNRATAADLL